MAGRELEASLGHLKDLLEAEGDRQGRPSLLRRALGKAERAALRVAADCPAPAWMNDLPAEFYHARTCRVEIRHLEVRE